MKQFFYTMAAMLVISLSANAQNNKASDMKIGGLAAKIENNNLLINWSSIQTDDNSNNYWEVQGSKDGKNFSTIGMVLGADPTSTEGGYKYKQQVTKIKPGLKYYRVLHIESKDKAVASNTIGLSK